MRHVAVISFAVAALLCAINSASAVTPGLYLGGAGGVDWLEDREFGPPAPPGTTANSDSGWALTGALGYRLANGIRAELEGAYRSNGGDVNTVPLQTNTRAWSVMANGLYEFDVGSGIHPYLGAGVGLADARLEVSLGPVSLHDSDMAFAYQGIGGVAFDLAENFQVFTEYRYLRTAGIGFTISGAKSDDEYAAHTMLIGFRWTFWSPSP